MVTARTTTRMIPIDRRKKHQPNRSHKASLQLTVKANAENDASISTFLLAISTLSVLYTIRTVVLSRSDLYEKIWLTDLLHLRKR